MVLGFCALQGRQVAAQKLSRAEETILRRVDAHYNHLHSLRTEFTERFDGLGLHRVESGTLLLSKPGRMRWTYTEPKGKLFVLDGQFAYSYTPGDGQVQRLPTRQIDDLRSPLRLLLGKTELRRELTGIVVHPAADGGATIAGRPVVAQGRLQSVQLQVDAAGQIESLQLTEVDGSTTGFTFRSTADNVPVTGGDFRFTPPPGVPVVDGLAPI